MNRSVIIIMGIVSNLSLKKRFHFWLLAALLSCCWGSAFLLNDVALKTLPVWWIISSRIILAALLSSAAYIIIYKHLPPIYTKQGLILGVIGNLLPFLFITTGQKDLSAGLTALLASTVPVFTMLLSFCFLKQRFRLSEFLGVAAIIFGVYWMFRSDLDSNRITAVFWVLAGVLCFGIVNIYGALQTGQSQVYSGLKLTTMMLNTASLPLIMATVVMIAQNGWPTMTDSALFSIAGLALIPTLLAALLFFYILKNGGALLASVAGSMVPVSVVVLGSVLADIPLTVSFFIALFFIVIGGLLTIR